MWAKPCGDGGEEGEMAWWENTRERGIEMGGLEILYGWGYKDGE